MAGNEYDKESLLKKIKKLELDIEQLENKMNEASRALEEHLKNIPPELPGRKYQRTFKRWQENAEKKRARYEAIRDEGLKKCEQLKELMAIYEKG